MMKRVVLITMLLVIAFNAFPGESSAFWWLFKKKKSEEPLVLPPSSYAISSSEYRHDYGDAVRVAGSDNEFVICESCPKPTALERLPKPVSIVIRMSTPPAPVAVVPIPGKPAEAIPSGLSTSAEQASSFAAVTEKGLNVKKNSDVIQVEQSAPTPTTIQHELSAANPEITSKHRIKTVYFPLNSSFISQTEKQKILDALESPKGRDVKVTGYTCELGSKEHNDRLALSRARAVASILETNGLKPTAVAGEGKCCYISVDKEKNRRAEIQEIN
jgi:outer membrane protein OmpA-like peptidoglycan-associated protein